MTPHDHAAPISLLAPDEPPAVTIERANGASAFVLLVDHAGNRLPRALGSLGLTDADLLRHIAWDIGALATARIMSSLLDAPMVAQTYSRLAIDCNRDPSWESAMPEISEHTTIPGNIGVTAQQRAARRDAIFLPYHTAIRALIDARNTRPTVLVAVHSFTPEYKSFRRPWHCGVLYNHNPALALPLLELLRAEPGLEVGDNEPYSITDDSDYTIPEHGERRGLPHIELEIRQDLIEHNAGQRAWAERIARLLPIACTKAGIAH